MHQVSSGRHFNERMSKFHYYYLIMITIKKILKFKKRERERLFHIPVIHSFGLKDLVLNFVDICWKELTFHLISFISCFEFLFSLDFTSKIPELCPTSTYIKFFWKLIPSYPSVFHSYSIPNIWILLYKTCWIVFWVCLVFCGFLVFFLFFSFLN